MQKGTRLAALLASALAMVLGKPARAIDTPYGIYLAGEGIQYVDMATNTARTLWTPAFNDYGYGRSMFVQTVGDSLYWTTYYNGGVWRSALDGTGASLIVAQAGCTRNIEAFGGKIYWSNETAGCICSANLDGTNVQTLVSGYTHYNTGMVDFSIHDGRFYWTNWDFPYVSTTDMSGGDYHQIQPTNAQRTFAIEMGDSCMYLADTSRNTIGRYTLGGTLQTILVANRSALGMDISGGYLYYNDQLSGQIFRVPLGGGAEEFVTSHMDWQLDVVPEPASMGLLALGGLAVLRRRR